VSDKEKDKDKDQETPNGNQELLGRPIRELGLKLEGSPVERFVEQLYRELEAKRLVKFRPPCYLTDEWGCPSGEPIIGIPFYLANAELALLEKQAHDLEDAREIMMYLRHEAGHAFTYAYKLHNKPEWKEMFGSFRRPYRENYRPAPFSRDYVRHLPGWYAQKHPDEDFAETFAVWLKPRSAWRREYAGWPAFAKLEFIDELAAEIGEARPKVTDRSRIEDIAEESSTLRQHYERKLTRYRLPRRSGADELLLKVFTTAPRSSTAPRAARVLREMRNDLRLKILRSGAFSEYLVHQVLRLMIARCEALGLYLRGSRRELKPHLLWVIARLAESYEERQLPRVLL